MPMAMIKLVGQFMILVLQCLSLLVRRSYSEHRNMTGQDSPTDVELLANVKGFVIAADMLIKRI